MNVTGDSSCRLASQAGNLFHLKGATRRKFTIRPLEVLMPLRAYRELSYRAKDKTYSQIQHFVPELSLVVWKSGIQYRSKTAHPSTHGTLAGICACHFTTERQALEWFFARILCRPCSDDFVLLAATSAAPATMSEPLSVLCLVLLQEAPIWSPLKCIYPIAILFSSLSNYIQSEPMIISVSVLYITH